MARVLYQDNYKETTFDKIRLGKTFYVDYNGHRDLYIRIVELADPDDPEFRYNAINLDLGSEMSFSDTEKVSACDTTFVVVPFTKDE